MAVGKAASPLPAPVLPQHDSTHDLARSEGTCRCKACKKVIKTLRVPQRLIILEAAKLLSNIGARVEMFNAGTGDKKPAVQC